MKKPKFLHGGFLINRKINATIVFYYKSTPLYSTISHFELLSENNGHPIQEAGFIQIYQTKTYGLLKSKLKFLKFQENIHFIKKLL